MRKVILDINGFKQESLFDEETINKIFIPLIEKLENIDQEKVIVYLAAPAGAGKSTIVTYLEVLSKELGYNNIQAIGIDGFHYPNSYLKKTMGMVNGEKQLLIDVKGCPETFDIDFLLEKIKSLKTGDVKWPIYDRNIHDVIKDGVEVNKNIVLIEGNWLLLNEDKWDQLEKLADYTIMIKADCEQLKSRLVNRKVKGKMTYQAAEKFVEKSDLKNVKRVNENSKQADLYLKLKDNNQLERIEYE